MKIAAEVRRTAVARLAELRAEGVLTAPKAEDFDELIASTSLLSRLITHLTLSRERHIAAADATSPNANRRAIGIAAAMQPSQLGVVLERNGRPHSRRA